ncbi:MAG: GntR family transcriptional regulator [Oscillospiraceae bacterium]|nr:GntR family transcriptional regulator [Oscillospiraceae bacterium]MDD4367570.1 GntR family transcriptional regulator [Oscillospiraceae bacterium]
MKRLDNSNLRRSSLTDRVYDELQNSILNGDFAPGDALPELTLSEMLGVSRTPVREAVARLESEGLVRTLPNRGTVVVGISEKDIDDIFTIRTLVEGLAARWAAARITPEQLDDLKQIVELQEFYVEKNDPVQIYQLDSRFHALLYQACGSHVLRQLLSNLHHYIQKARELSLEKPERAIPSVHEHRDILEAIAAHDGLLAERLTSQHIHNAHQNILKMI